MSKSEKEAQKTRADRLRNRINEIKSGNWESVKPNNPKDYIERKMRETEKKKADDSDKACE